MEAIKEITVQRTRIVVEEQDIPVDSSNGLKYAAVHTGTQVGYTSVIALFDSTYWARKFVNATAFPDEFCIVDIETGEECE